jgi:arabinose-5-phosphate isomerase
LNIKAIAQEVFEIESKEIKNLTNNLTQDFEKSVKDIYKSKGKLIVSGMGKSGIIGKKIAATMASTGTPSFFLHPAEAYHGDLGMIESSDIVLLISNSGETDEVLKLIPFLKSQGNTIIGMSGNPDSTLAKNSTYHLNIHIQKEACPLQLAPTSSTTATLVMGDALAIALMKLRDFKDSDFAQFHPGGSLGRRLLTKVEDVMHKENLPICTKKSNIKEIIQIVSRARLGLAIVMEEDSSIIGIITDGDIRRAMESQEERFFSLKAKDLMTQNPKTINPKAKLMEAQTLMAKYKVNSLLVVDSNRLVGVVQIYDLGI